MSKRAITKTAQHVGVSDEYAEQVLNRPQYSFREIADAHLAAAKQMWEARPAIEHELRAIFREHSQVLAELLLEAKREADGR